jgi:hypothetical protein
MRQLCLGLFMETQLHIALGGEDASFQIVHVLGGLSFNLEPESTGRAVGGEVEMLGTFFLRQASLQ